MPGAPENRRRVESIHTPDALFADRTSTAGNRVGNGPQAGSRACGCLLPSVHISVRFVTEMPFGSGRSGLIHQPQAPR
jgi:hypothetical protein